MRGAAPGIRGIGCPGRRAGGQGVGLEMGQLQQVRQNPMTLPGGDFAQGIQKIRGVTGGFGRGQGREWGHGGGGTGLFRDLGHSPDRNELRLYHKGTVPIVQPWVITNGKRYHKYNL